MSKARSPIFSFTAHGSLNHELTFSRFRNSTVAKAIPSHPDANTAPQQTQRSCFKDCSDRWHTLSKEEKQHCLVCGNETRLTAYQYFMRECLQGRY